MNSLPKLFIGIFITFLSAWIGLVALPFIHLGNMQPQQDEETGELFPPTPDGLAAHGAIVYGSMGCMYCHSQQVRADYIGSDIERGWGARRTVPRDYIHQKPVYLGTMRTGPDLTNIGARQPSALWHYQHLYNPQAFAAESTMPPFKFLFEKRKVVGEPSPDAFTVPGLELEEGYELVPTYDARALVAYLISLNRNYPLKEAPLAD